LKKLVALGTNFSQKILKFFVTTKMLKNFLNHVLPSCSIFLYAIFELSARRHSLSLILLCSNISIND